MQVIYKDKDKEGNSREADSVGVIICARRISRHLKEKCLGGVGRRKIGIWISGGVFGSHQEEVWRKRERVSKDRRIKKIRIERKDNRENSFKSLEE